MTFVKRMTGLCGLLTALVLATGCSDYTYFNVKLLVNQRGDHPVTGQEEGRIGSCTVAVLSGDKKIEATEVHKMIGADDICNPNTISNIKSEEGYKNLGVMNYSTARDGGSLVFVVTMHDATTDEPDVAQGEVEGEVSSGKVMALDLIINSCKRDGEYRCPRSGM